MPGSEHSPHDHVPDGDDDDATLPLDPTHLEEMCGGDAAFESAVIGEYRRSVAEAMAQLDASVAAADLTRIRSFAHAIRGSSAALGAVPLTGLCRTLEALAAEHCDPAEAKHLLERIHMAYAALEQTLEARERAA